MDLWAFQIQRFNEVDDYVSKYYGIIPRPRGCRFMKVEIPIENPTSEQDEMFNKHIGEDVIYFHTRCGGSENDSRSNYIACGGKEWEEQHKDKFIESINDDFDATYRDHYFKAVQNEEYDKIIKAFTHAKENNAKEETNWTRKETTD